MEKSLLEKYLQDELETMRQAFQIRLGQLEKRYKKQLISEQQRKTPKKRLSGEQSANPSSSSSTSEVVRRRHPNPQAISGGSQVNASKRRNSWHSYITSEQELEKLALPDDPRSGSSLGIDSDHYITDDSDMEAEPVLPGEGNNDCKESNEVNRKQSSSNYYFSDAPEGNKMVENNQRLHHQYHHHHRQQQQQQQQQPNHIYAQPRKMRVRVADGWSQQSQGHYKQPRKYPKEGLKGGDRSWREGSGEKETGNEPHLPPMSDDLSREEDNIPVDDEAKILIQKKIEEYREKMMQYFQEKSEAQICNIEERYLKQMDEMKKKYDWRASQKVSHLTSRIKDLENMLDVQTLV